ncbi:MAG: hypothetical protein H7332_07860 [Bdellovibrionales bacterium]|nr:hypothetical protein [Ramlibacter sp.]
MHGLQPGINRASTRFVADGDFHTLSGQHICNACRYCEGFCAVFPAMTRRLEFGKVTAN